MNDIDNTLGRESKMVQKQKRGPAPSREEISVSTLRDDLPSLLSRIALLGEEFTIVKNGRPYAILSPAGGHETAKAARRISGNGKVQPVVALSVDGT